MTWLPVAEAARVLGMTEQALRKRLARGTMESRKNNRGNLVVLVSSGGERQAQPRLDAGTPSGTTGQDARLEPRRVPAGESGSLPLSAHREIVDAIQAAHAATLVAIQSLVERQECQHREAMAAIEGQVDCWRERADRAELIAEQANAMLHDLVSRIMALPVPESGGIVSWWRRLFGQSSRSNIGG